MYKESIVLNYHSYLCKSFIGFVLLHSPYLHDYYFDQSLYSSFLNSSKLKYFIFKDFCRIFLLFWVLPLPYIIANGVRKIWYLKRIYYINMLLTLRSKSNLTYVSLM